MSEWQLIETALRDRPIILVRMGPDGEIGFGQSGPHVMAYNWQADMWEAPDGSAHWVKDGPTHWKPFTASAPSSRTPSEP
jgi:hypothetical protein